jgi:hypothetical protein
MDPAWDGVVACDGEVGRTLRVMDSSSVPYTVSTFAVCVFFFPFVLPRGELRLPGGILM